MSQQHQQQIEEDEDHSTLSADEFVQLHLHRTPVNKSRIGDSNQQQQEGSDEANVLGYSTTTITMDLPRRHRKLPAELDRQIFLCFNPVTQRKFICGLGWDFYAMFRHRLLIKSKRLCNPAGNVWSRSNRNVTISEDGLVARNNTNGQHIHAKKGFPISVANCRMNDFPGTICYYYEVKSRTVGRFAVGFRHGGYVFSLCVGESNYAIPIIAPNSRSEEYEYTELPVEARPVPPNVQGNVFGCGLLIDPDNKVATFFTLNGILLGKHIPINPSVDRLYSTVSIFENVLTLEANFGDDKDKPFAYDIKNCPGMGLDCI